MSFLLTGARIYDGCHEKPWNGWVSVENQRIMAVSRADQKPPRTQRVVDLEGRWLMPGLIDTHVHLALDGSPDPAGAVTAVSHAQLALTMAANARCTLEAGFTTVRDLGARDHVDIALRQAVENGLVSGPRILCAGQMICMTGGHGWQFGRQADGPDEVRRAVREQLRAGADVIKLMATGGICTAGVEPGQSQLDSDELASGIAEAHKAGRKTAAHAQGPEGIRNAVAAGIDSIEHGTYLDDEVIADMRRRGTYLVPTLAAGTAILEAGTAGGIAEFIVAKSAAHRSARLDSLSRARAAGVKIAFGTDAGTPNNPHGGNARELGLLVETGWSPAEALQAATSIAADLLGLSQSLGSVEAGKIADLLVVDDDPLANPTCLTQPQNLAAVYQAGRLVAGRWARPAMELTP